jgi:hypothetical protein
MLEIIIIFCVGTSFLAYICISIDELSFVSSFSTAIVMRVAYGHRVVSDDDEFIRLANDQNYALQNSGTPGSTLIDLFPFCKHHLLITSSRYLTNGSIVGIQVRHMPRWFPGTYYANFARDWRPAIEKMHNVPFEIVQMQMVRCFTFSIIY